MTGIYEPTWMIAARGLIGTKEVVGPKHNSKILGWLAKLGAWWRDDETPWCGVFVAYILRLEGFSVPKLYMRAKDWATWGANLRASHVAPGAVMVFNRAGGGHVGFYVGEDRTRYYVLGGNQGNAVSITPIAKNRCVAIRWPKGVAVIGGPRIMSMDEAASENEQ